MRRKYVLIWCLFSAVAALGQQTKTLTFTGRVIDYNARPVAGATVVCYKSDYELNQRSYEHLKQVKTTSDGRFSLQVETESSHPYLVAGKQGLALGWRQIYSLSEPIIRLGRPSQYHKPVQFFESGFELLLLLFQLSQALVYELAVSGSYVVQQIVDNLLDSILLPLSSLTSSNEFFRL